MRICIDCRMIRHSGIGTFLKEVVGRLVLFDHEFTLLGSPSELRQYEGATTRVMSFEEPIYSLREQLRFPRRVFDWTEGFLFPHYNVPLWPVKRTVVVLHDLAPLALPELFSGLEKRFYAHVFFRVAAAKAQKIVAVSEFTKREIVDRLRIDPRRVQVIYHGPGRSFPEHASLSSERIAAYGIKKPYLLAVGNLKPHKNLGLLVNAFALLRERGWPELRLVLVGSKWNARRAPLGPSGTRLDEMRDVGVTAPGYVPDRDMPAIYHHAALLVVPSLYEGFGLTPLEALRFGTLPLVSNTASLVEVIDDLELRFSPRGPEELAAKIEFFLSQPAVVRQKVLEQQKRCGRYSWDSAALSYKELFEELNHKDNR
jgi:glycosyltransferase involved in cell wall biosynthesis